MSLKTLTISEAAAKAGVSRTAIYSAIKRGALPERYSKGNMVVREEELLSWQANKTKSGGRAKGTALSLRHKANISAAQKRRWQDRQAQ